jgi:hypothetical protein
MMPPNGRGQPIAPDSKKVIYQHQIRVRLAIICPIWGMPAATLFVNFILSLCLCGGSEQVRKRVASWNQMIVGT